MANLNKVILIGNLTRDPESRTTGGGMVIANMGLAVNRRYKNAQGVSTDETTFVDITAFGPTANFAAQYLRKGNQVSIDGRLKLEQWQDRNTGQNRSKLIVIAENIQNLSPRNDQQQPQGRNISTPTPAPPPPPPPFPTNPAPPPQQAPQQAPQATSAPVPQPLPPQPELSDESIEDIPF